MHHTTPGEAGERPVPRRRLLIRADSWWKPLELLIHVPQAGPLSSILLADLLLLCRSPMQHAPNRPPLPSFCFIAGLVTLFTPCPSSAVHCAYAPLHLPTPCIVWAPGSVAKLYDPEPEANRLSRSLLCVFGAVALYIARGTPWCPSGLLSTTDEASATSMPTTPPAVSSGRSAPISTSP